ncbi:MAG: nucleotidyl transferase [Candidatus Competibacteraceae bacterium]|nr:nucleotidyl transferase [Candidatus Competibacteraceae bacterium]
MDDIKVVILCGGKGTRSFPFTEYFPKVMMPIDGTPIIIHLMQSYAMQGFTKFVLAAGYRQEMLRDYFKGRFREWEIEIVDTGIESDTGERIKYCSNHVGETFFATYGDGLGNVNVTLLLEFHRRMGGLATLTSVPLRSQYGLVRFDERGRVESFAEKPLIYGYWINAGFFVFQRGAFDLWRGGNLEMDVLPALAEAQTLYTYHHEGFWRSMDTSKDQHELEKLHQQHGPVWLDHTGQAGITH